MSSGRRAARQAARFPAVALPLEKSIATSTSTSALASSSVTVTPVFPASANSPASLPIDELPREATAAVILISERSPAARTSACPIRPLMPMMAARITSGPSEGEETLHTLEEPIFAGRMPLRLALERLFQLADQFLLLRGKIHRRLDDDLAKQIAARPTANGLYTLVAQAKDTAGLSF